MERHRAQLADQAIEEQLEVQTAFREQVCACARLARPCALLPAACAGSVCWACWRLLGVPVSVRLACVCWACLCQVAVGTGQRGSFDALGDVVGGGSPLRKPGNGGTQPTLPLPSPVRLRHQGWLSASPGTL